MFKTGSKNSKQSLPRDGTFKNKISSFGEYEFPKFSGKMSDKCFPTKVKNKSKISPIVNACSEQAANSPMSLNVCFGKKLLRSPSNSQTLEFNDRSSENREGASEVGAGGAATCPPRAHGSVYGRLGNTYGRLHVLGSGIGRIERHLSSSCGNIDHYCAPVQGNPRFRIESQAVEADRGYQRIPPEEAPPGIKGISKGSLQWLMVNRWLPLWVANTGGKNEYKVIDLDFSIYDDVQYPLCTTACADEHCPGRNREASLPHRNCLIGMEADPRAPQGYMEDILGGVECDSPEPDSSAACSSGEPCLVGQDSVGDNEPDLSADNEPSMSEACEGEASSSSESASPAEGHPS